MSNRPARKKAKIALHITNPRLRALVEEQIIALTLPKEESVNEIDAIITDDDKDGKHAASPIPTLTINQDFQIPLRLGELNDRILYILSGRNHLVEREEVYDLGVFWLNAYKNSLTHKNSGNKIHLTDKERIFLRTLLESENYKLSRITLLETVWGYIEGTETHTIETHLYRLRQKLEPYQAEMLISADGEGNYYLNLDLEK